MLKKIVRTAALLLLALAFEASLANGQKPVNQEFSASNFYGGVQSSPGSPDPVSGFVYGNTFTLTSSGEWDTRFLTISVHYRTMFQGVGVTGGTWTLTVIRLDGSPLGTIYGDVTAGEIQTAFSLTALKQRTASRKMILTLRSTGATGILGQKEYVPSQPVEGTFELVTDLKTLESTGISHLNY